MMDIAVSFNPRELSKIRQQLETLSKSTGITVQWLCADQMRLACSDGIEFVAPWNGETSGTTSKQRATGEGAVEHDLDRAFARIDKNAYAFWENKKTGIRFAKNKATGKVFTIDADKWDRQDLMSIHHKLRNRRGRVLKQDRQYWVKKSALNKYIKDTKKHVGELKASWLPGYYYFQSIVGGGKRVAGWITRHRGEGTHSPLSSMSKSGNGYLSASSTAHHVGAIRKSLIPYILKNRERSMSRYAPKRLQQLAAQFNANGTTITPIRELAAV